VDKKIRDKCSVEIVECIYIRFYSVKTEEDRIGEDDGVIHEFLDFCSDNDIEGIRGPGGTCGAGIYAYCHRNNDKEKIIEFFENAGIKINLYTT